MRSVAAAIATSLLLLPGAAGAVRVVGTATGAINDDARTEGGGSQVFGLDADGLVGMPFRIDFAYDFDLAPPDANPAAGRGLYTASGDPDWLDLALTVNQHTVTFRGENRYADVIDGDGFDNLQLAIESHLSDQQSGH